MAYTYNDAEGNTNSDSNADFQGDVIWLDPRAPNQFGRQPGLINHMFKGAFTYRFDMGLELGGFYRWNSGLWLSQTFSASRRHLPARVDNVGLRPVRVCGHHDETGSPPVSWVRSTTRPGVSSICVSSTSPTSAGVWWASSSSTCSTSPTIKVLLERWTSSPEKARMPSGMKSDG